jgi:hypothetical protein
MRISPYFRTTLGPRGHAPRSLLDGIARTKNRFRAPPNTMAFAVAKTIDTNVHVSRALVDAGTSSARGT